MPRVRLGRLPWDLRGRLAGTRRGRFATCHKSCVSRHCLDVPVSHGNSQSEHAVLRSSVTPYRLEIANGLPGNLTEFGTGVTIGPRLDRELRFVFAACFHVTPFQGHGLNNRQPGSVYDRAERNVDGPALEGRCNGFPATAG